MNKKNIYSRYSFINYNRQIENFKETLDTGEKYLRYRKARFNSLYTLYSSDIKKSILNHIMEKFENKCYYKFNENDFKKAYDDIMNSIKNRDDITYNASKYYREDNKYKARAGALTRGRDNTYQGPKRIITELIKDIKSLNNNNIKWFDLYNKVKGTFNKFYADVYIGENVSLNSRTNPDFVVCYWNKAISDKTRGEALDNCHKNTDAFYDIIRDKIYAHIKENLVFTDAILDGVINSYINKDYLNEYYKRSRINIDDTFISNVIAVLKETPLEYTYSYKGFLDIIESIKGEYTGGTLICEYGTGDGRNHCISKLNELFEGIKHNALKQHTINKINEYIKTNYLKEEDKSIFCNNIVDRRLGYTTSLFGDFLNPDDYDDIPNVDPNNKDFTKLCEKIFDTDEVLTFIRNVLTDKTINNDSDLKNGLNDINSRIKGRLGTDYTTNKKGSKYLDNIFNDLITNYIQKKKIFEDIYGVMDSIMFYLESDVMSDEDDFCNNLGSEYKTSKNNSTRERCKKNIGNLPITILTKFNITEEDYKENSKLGGGGFFDIEYGDDLDIKPDTTSTQYKEEKIDVDSIPSFMKNDPDFVYGSSPVSNNIEDETENKTSNKKLIIYSIILVIIIFSYFITKK